MKKEYLLSLLFVCSFVITTRAQIGKGTVWLGGSANYNHYTEDSKDPTVVDYKSSSFNFSPAIGIAIRDNLVAGIRLTYGKGKSGNDGTILNSKNNSYGGGLFIRRYIPVINRLYFFGEAGAAYVYNKGDATFNYSYNGSITKATSTTKSWNGTVGVTPGLAFAVTKKFQLETSLNSLLTINYSKNKTTADRPGTGYDKTTDNLTAGITDGKVQFNIGCRFLINNKG